LTREPHPYRMNTVETKTKRAKGKDAWAETAKLVQAFEAGTDEVGGFMRRLDETKSEPVREV